MENSISEKPKIIAIVGPTASGKSALAVSLAKKFKGEVVSADSRQVYKGMDIGTGKVPRDRTAHRHLSSAYLHQGVLHHLLDVASPRHAFTAAQFQKLGERAIKKIIARGKIPVVCGGTGLYIDALLRGYAFPSVPPNPALRKRLEKKSAAELFRKLKKRDPARAKNIDRHNKRRLVRALEIIHATKKPIPALAKSSPYEILTIGLNPPREALYRRIESRYRGWFRKGFLNEVRRLKKSGISGKRFDELGLNYKWASLFLDGKISRKEMDDESLKDLRRYAKRQETWWRRNSNIRWVKSRADALKTVAEWIRN